MDWLLKLRRALLAFSARLKHRKSVGGAGGDQCGGVGGLLKLQDDVQMCGYQDVQIMWNMLSKAQQEEIQIMATTDQSKPNQKQRRRQRPSCSFRAFFGPATQSCVLVRLESNACSLLN
ncbi:PREDICTED: uncharacterized protein LOC101313896 [Fragaria vesca subsp. vesca]|uniref:uncharacterized protein LOC101313896 n=1 Tax=Fragaria vesca subsp. vesca TaxID=101020 RepID=UPI0002C33388|nr:PREDICTED: uncharacterized protein LOC101313896 [Fragaria vesca subsp. vesca]